MTCTKFVAFLLLRKFCTTPTKPCHASTSSGFMECMKFSCCIKFWMPGPSNISALNFSRLSPGNDWQMYLRHSPSLSRAFTYCLISSNFICRGGYYLVSVYKWFIYDIFVSISECFSRLPILLNPMFRFIATVPHT